MHLGEENGDIQNFVSRPPMGEEMGTFFISPR
jgi:hypothetical protein